MLFRTCLTFIRCRRNNSYPSSSFHISSLPCDWENADEAYKYALFQLRITGGAMYNSCPVRWTLCKSRWYRVRQSDLVYSLHKTLILQSEECTLPMTPTNPRSSHRREMYYYMQSGRKDFFFLFQSSRSLEMLCFKKWSTVQTPKYFIFIVSDDSRRPHAHIGSPSFFFFSFFLF